MIPLYLLNIKQDVLIGVLWEHTNPKGYKGRIFNASLAFSVVCVTVFTDIMLITAFLMFLYDLFKMCVPQQWYGLHQGCIPNLLLLNDLSLKI